MEKQKSHDNAFVLSEHLIGLIFPPSGFSRKMKAAEVIIRA